MTEGIWSSCSEPQVMLDWLREQGRLSERKTRLFAAACCRRIWHRLVDERNMRAVDVTERYADGQSNEEELAGAEAAAWAAARELRGMNHDRAEVLRAAARTAWPPAVDYLVRYQVLLLLFAIRNAVGTAESGIHCTYLRDIVCNPFRAVPTIDPLVLSWHDGAAVKLAQVIYNDRILPEGKLDPARLTILGDALEEAGCDNEDILAHCRQQGGVHVRGCWVIDLLLNKA